MELTSNVRRWGNSAGVLLPREWLGSKVKIFVLESTKSVKEEIFSLLGEYMEDILGIYLVGSYARAEQEDESDIDVLVFSNNLKKEIISGKYNINIIPFELVKKSILSSPMSFVPRIIEAKPLLNSAKLEELKRIKVNKNHFKEFIQDCRRIIKINQDFIKLDLENSDIIQSESVIYSLILRLRGIYLIKCILHSKNYYKKEFEQYLAKEIGNYEEKKVYSLYVQVRDSKKIKEKITIKTAQALLNLLRKEVEKYGQ